MSSNSYLSLQLINIAFSITAGCVCVCLFVSVNLATPPQQLDRDPAVVFSKHMPDSREGRIKTANFYTAVTRRSDPASAPPVFDALNRQMVPVPQLMDKESPQATAYNKGSITPWRNQVTKYDGPL